MPCLQTQTRSSRLTIRSFDGDAGLRPLDDAVAFWTAPDIWVEGGPDRTTASEGEEIVVNVRVTNCDTRPYEDIDVEAWVCDYTAGPLPAGRLDPPDRVTGFAAGPLNPGQSAVVACAPAWVPTSAQVSMNAGHLCLAANVRAATPLDGAELPAATPIAPLCDCHHAQRNIALVSTTEMASASLTQVMRLHARPGGGGGGTAVHVEPLPPHLLPVSGKGGRVGFGAGELDLLLSNEVGRGLERWELGDPATATVELEGDGVKDAHNAELAPAYDDPGVIAVNIVPPRSARTGTILLYDVVSNDLASGDPLGGARLMVVVA